MGYRVKPFTMSVRNNSTQEFVDVGLLGSDVDADIQDIEKKLEWFVTPEMYGAVGDGVTDDSQAFQDAVDSCVINDTDLYLAKRYKVGEINITGNIRIVGGELIAKLNEYNQTKNILSSTAQSTIVLDSININGNATSRTSEVHELENMIRFEGCKSVTIKNCEIHHHAQNDSSSDETMWYLRHVHAINLINCEKVFVVNNYIHNNHTEQICIGSVNATTKAIVSGNMADHNNDAMALFLLYNLKNVVVEGNICNNNSRSFINVLTNNATITNNRIINSNSRGIASEAFAQAARLKNIIIRNNYIYGCLQGGIDCGINNVIIEGNIIEECGRIAINVSGKITGNDSSVVGTDILPWDVNELQDGENVSIINNIIKNHDGHEVASPILVRSEINITNNVTSYGSIYGITIKDNTIDVQVNNSSMSGICFTNGDVISDIYIENNRISGYNYCGLMLSYNSGDMLNELENIWILGNRFTPKPGYAGDYVIRNITAHSLKNVVIKNNIVEKTPKRALFVSPTLNSIKGYYYVAENEVGGAPQTLRDYRYHVNGNVGFSANMYKVYSFSSLPTGMQLNVGDILTLQIPEKNIDNVAITYSAGTTGTLNGCTGTTTAGSNVISINGINLLKVGDDIVIPGSGLTKTKVFEVLEDDNLIRVLDNIPNAVSNASISYYNPTLITGLNMTLQV